MQHSPRTVSRVLQEMERKKELLSSRYQFNTIKELVNDNVKFHKIASAYLISYKLYAKLKKI